MLITRTCGANPGSRPATRTSEGEALRRFHSARSHRLGETLLGPFRFKALGGRRGLRFQIIAAGERYCPAPFGEVGVRIAQLGPHGGAVDRLLEALGKLTLGGHSTFLGDDLSGDIAPVDDEQISHAWHAPAAGRREKARAS